MGTVYLIFGIIGLVMVIFGLIDIALQAYKD